jgi:hypothetical protein
LCFIGAPEAEIAACEMAVPRDEEERLLAEIANTAEPDSHAEAPGGRDTVVAFALLR